MLLHYKNVFETIAYYYHIVGVLFRKDVTFNNKNSCAVTLSDVVQEATN